MKRVVLLLITVYQRCISPVLAPLSSVFGLTSACKYTPTCSHYMYEAIETRGIIEGLFLGIKRIGRCHPWSTGGYDPLPKQT